MKRFIIACLFFAGLSASGIAQSNEWVRVTGEEVGERTFPILAYVPALDEFIVTYGTQDESGTDCPYTVQGYTRSQGRWINLLPHDSLYGVWADSTGFAYDNGRVGRSVFGSWSFVWNNVDGYLRPNLGGYKATRAYNQFCLNPDDNKIYFYVNNQTFTYDAINRLWDTLTVNDHPNGASDAASYLKWGSLCYDPFNDEILLFGGGAVDRENGSPGTWTFKPATSTWTRLDLDVAPGPRAHAPMVYDPANEVIVLFGGDHLDFLRNDTWIYHCATRTWEKKVPAVSPAPRAGHALLHLPKSGAVVMLGGYTYETSQAGFFEIWTYDVSANTWGLIKHMESGATWPRLSTPKMVFSGLADVDTGDVIIALGDSAASQYSFYPETYRLACDPAQIDASGTQTYGMTSDTTAYRTDDWMAPGWYTSGTPAIDTAATAQVLADVPVGVWTAIESPKKPGGAYRAWGTTIIDVDRDQIVKWSGGHVAHCGTDVPQYKLSENRWYSGYWPSFPLDYNRDNNCNPGPFTFNHRPFMDVHTYDQYDYDINLKKVLYASRKYTYIYNVETMDWERTNVVNPPNVSGSARTGLEYTPHGVVMFKGSSYTGNYLYLFDADSLKWDMLPATGDALSTFYADQGGFCYDSRRDRLVMVQGKSSETARLVTYDFATHTVTEQSPANSGLATGTDHYRECVYLPTQDKVFFQIRRSSGHLVYDCASNGWATMPVSLGSGVNGDRIDDRGTGLMYDPRRNLVWCNTHDNDNYVFRPDTQAGPMTVAGPTNDPLETGLSVSPNPFNPTVRFCVTLARQQPVSLRVYNSAGRLVHEAARGTLSKGRYIMAWTAASVPTGWYVARLRAGARCYIESLMLLK